MKDADKLVIGGDIKAWLYKVAIYKIKEYRKQKSKFDYLEDIGELPYKDKYWDGEPNSVFRYLMLSDFLTNIEKNIVHDYFFGRLTPEQIAEKYNITENAFFIRMTRIKKKISDYIKDNEVSL
jgi:DNA-directed RNA polymerase specialized sigma24 family protein